VLLAALDLLDAPESPFHGEGGTRSLMERLLDIKDAAGFLNVSAMTIRRWTNSGKLNCYRVGGKR